MVHVCSLNLFSQTRAASMVSYQINILNFIHIALMVHVCSLNLSSQTRAASMVSYLINIFNFILIACLVAGELTQVLTFNTWVHCASGHVFATFPETESPWPCPAKITLWTSTADRPHRPGWYQQSRCSLSSIQKLNLTPHIGWTFYLKIWETPPKNVTTYDLPPSTLLLFACVRSEAVP